MQWIHVTTKNASVCARLSALALTCLALSAHAACRTDLGPSATPSADFTVNANGTVLHASTGLMWKAMR